MDAVMVALDDAALFIAIFFDAISDPVAGYISDALRNGWFHIGDGFRYDEDGYFYFVDRIKDAIRHRGENISSFEVEAEANSVEDADPKSAETPLEK